MTTPIITKKAMALPVSGTDFENLKSQGLYVIQDMMSKMPNTTQKDMHEALKGIIDSGASEFFGSMKPKTVINLPEIYILDPQDIFEVDGKHYASIKVDPPRLVGQKWTAPSGTPYVKGQQFEGEITALDIDTGLPVILPLAPIKDKMMAPTEDAERVLQKANARIGKYNEKIRSISKATGASKLVLQIDSTKREIETRLATLESIKQAVQRQLEHMQGSPKQVFDAYTSGLKDRVQRGELSIRDAYDTILYLHMSTPEQLVIDIEQGNVNVPAELREGILAIARKESESKIQKTREEEQKERERRERSESKEIPDMHETELAPFVQEDIPTGKERYKEVKTTKSLWHHIASLKSKIAGSERDAQELIKIKQSIENMEKYMGSLEKGQRSKDFLNTPEGKPVLNAMNDFLNESSLFIKRYATDIIQDGKVNPKLMGTEGTEGNAIIAISLTGMYNVVRETIGMYTGGTLSMVPTTPAKELAPAPETAPVSTPVASDQDKIQKLSSLLWKAFEDRMRIK